MTTDESESNLIDEREARMLFAMGQPIEFRYKNHYNKVRPYHMNWERVYGLFDNLPYPASEYEYRRAPTVKHK